SWTWLPRYLILCGFVSPTFKYTGEVAAFTRAHRRWESVTLVPPWWLVTQCHAVGATATSAAADAAVSQAPVLRRHRPPAPPDPAGRSSSAAGCACPTRRARCSAGHASFHRASKRLRWAGSSKNPRNSVKVSQRGKCWYLNQSDVVAFGIPVTFSISRHGR